MFYVKLFLCLFLMLYFIEGGLCQRRDESKPDPCEFNPKMPNFSKRGRRKSTAKCYEYIWRVKYRLEKSDQDLLCALSKCKTCSGGGIGGRDTLDGEFPHMAAIGWPATDRRKRWQFLCGGSLISETFVLTAGHCVRAVLDTTISSPVPEIVRLGNKNIANEGKHLDVGIIRIIPHQNYKPPKKYFDIALMELAGPMQFTYYIQPACLLVDDAVERFGPAATATGWGITRLNGQPSEELQAVHIQLLDSDYCDPLLACNRHWCGLQDHQICAANLSGGVDTCFGDSGGPLQVKLPLPDSIKNRASFHGIVGVTSFGFKCALKDNPGVYSRVSYFLDWIENIVWRS